MAAVASLQFGQQLMAALVPTLKGTLSIGGATQAVLSPLSIWFALVLLLNGAGLPSSTYNELWQAVTGSPPGASSNAAALAALNGQAAALRTALARQAAGGNTLVVADGIWTKGKEVSPEFASSMKSLFKAEVASVPNATPINEWAERVTNGLIPQVVSPSLNFNMVLANALYFKGVWEHPFEKRRTRAEAFAAVTKDSTAKGCSSNFRTSCTEEVQVPMMTRVFDPSDNARATQAVALAAAPGKYRAVRLPYKGSSGLAAVFVLPDAEAYESIMDAAREITAAAVLDPKAWQDVSEPMAVSLPRFKVEVKQLGLKEILQKLGIRSAFGQADFSKASADPLVLTNVLHSAVVQVDEFGTEAAAATAAVTLKSALDPEPPKSLVFNRPFLFFLVEGTTKTVLFQGAIADPRGSS